MIQTLRDLSVAQWAILRNAHKYGVRGVKGKVNLNGVMYRTQMILEERGYIEKDFYVRDEDERVDIQQALEVEVKSAGECVERNWKAAYEHLKAAEGYDKRLNFKVYWLTAKAMLLFEGEKDANG